MVRLRASVRSNLRTPYPNRNQNSIVARYCEQKQWDNATKELVAQLSFAE